MDKIWLQSYSPGVPATINPDEYTSITDLFEQGIKKFGPLPSYSNFGHEISFDDLDRLTQQFAAYLTGDLGLKKGDRVAIMMPNILQYPVSLFAILRAGLVVVNVNPLYTARELEYQLNDSGAEAIVVVENFANTLAEVVGKTKIKHVVTTQIGDLFGFPSSFIVNSVIKYVKKMVPPFHIPGAVRMNDALAIGAKHPFQKVEQSLDDTAFLQYTGGTTGVSKGAVLSHRNMVSNLLQAFEWTKYDLKEGQEIVVTPLPLYHIFSLTANALFGMRTGSKCLLITNPRDFPAFVKTLAKEDFSIFIGINTLFNALLHTPGFDEINFAHLKLTLGGGMSVQRNVAEKWKEVTGDTLLEAYGLTETSPAVTINPIGMPEYNGSIGLPVPSTEISIRDENGQEQPVGESGELWVKGPQVMSGYWQHEDENAKVFSEDGWLRTGDIAKVDEKGFVFLVDRLKDMILISGFNVYPNEVEAVIAAHEKVLEVGVIGVSNQDSGEIVKAVVVKEDDSLTEKELQDYCHKNLTAYKCPKLIQFVDEWAHTGRCPGLRQVY